MCFDLSESLTIEFEMKRFFSFVNSFYHIFRGATPIVLCHLLQTFAYVFYGCQLWSCNDCQLNRLRVAWNDAIEDLQRRKTVSCGHNALCNWAFALAWDAKKAQATVFVISHSV